MSSRLPLPARSVLAVAIALIAGHALADQSPPPAPQAPGSESSAPATPDTPDSGSGQNPQPPAQPGQDDGAQEGSNNDAGNAPVTNDGVSGELLHTMLGLSMEESPEGRLSDDLITAFPVDWKTMQPDPDYDPAWPTLATYQTFRLVQHEGAPAPEYTRTPDGHFLLANSDFIYSQVSHEGGHNPNPPQRQSEHPAEYVLSHRAQIPVKVTPEGIILSAKMRLIQTAIVNGPDGHHLEAPAPKAIAKTDTVPFKTTIQAYTYKTNLGQDAYYSLSVEQGKEDRQVKLCGYGSFAPIHRNTCVVWRVPDNWQFGMALNFDRIEVTDERYSFPSELSEGGSQTWVTRSQPWPRL